MSATTLLTQSGLQVDLFPGKGPTVATFTALGNRDLEGTGFSGDSLIAISVFFWASEQLVAVEADGPAGAPRPGADALLRGTSVVRAVLSLYTSLCLAAIAASHLDAIKFPPLGDKPFPWVHRATVP